MMAQLVRRVLLLLGFVMVLVTANALAQSQINAEIAPMGKLRVAMNSGTPVLLTRTSEGCDNRGSGLRFE